MYLIILFSFAGLQGAQPPTDVHIDNFGATDGRVTAVVKWSPDNNSMNCYYSIYWMSADSSDSGSVKLMVCLEVIVHDNIQ